MKIPKLFAKRPYQKKENNKFSSSSLTTSQLPTDVVNSRIAKPYSTGVYVASNYEEDEQEPMDDVESLKKLYKEISGEIKHITKIIEDSSAIAEEIDCGYRRYVDFNAWYFTSYPKFNASIVILISIQTEHQL